MNGKFGLLGYGNPQVAHWMGNILGRFNKLVGLIESL